MVKLELSAESWGNGKARSLRLKRASSSWSLVFFETNSPRSELTDSVSNSTSSQSVCLNHGASHCPPDSDLQDS